jgi:hypothetical protein
MALDEDLAKNVVQGTQRARARAVRAWRARCGAAARALRAWLRRFGLVDAPP